MATKAAPARVDDAIINEELAKKDPSSPGLVKSPVTEQLRELEVSEHILGSDDIDAGSRSRWGSPHIL